MMIRRFHLIVLAAIVPVGLVGCNDASKPESSPVDAAEVDKPESDPSPPYDLAADFHDEVASNREDDGTVNDLQFVDTQGQTVRIDQFANRKNVLLVFTRGFSGQLCSYCTTQTSRLIANYDKFLERDTEVLLVYPGGKDQLGEFMQASIEQSERSKFPFPVLLDEDLAAVNRLNIADQLAFPSTFIIDKDGRVTLSYVGKNMTDRPSIKALLAQLDAMP
ncbi:MAG: peroxiredoxin family protein [Pirellulales bacterium]|nr:peroxiredoxin family protein [Pirellulales bacterium]